MTLVISTRRCWKWFSFSKIKNKNYLKGVSWISGQFVILQKGCYQRRNCNSIGRKLCNIFIAWKMWVLRKGGSINLCLPLFTPWPNILTYLKLYYNDDPRYPLSKGEEKRHSTNECIYIFYCNEGEWGVGLGSPRWLSLFCFVVLDAMMVVKSSTSMATSHFPFS